MADTRAGSELREISRRAVRERISKAAMALFVANGFEKTKVDDIAAEIGISARSVFRYFATKEDIVVSGIDMLGIGITENLEKTSLDEPPWVALRQAMRPLLDQLAANPQTNLGVVEMVLNTPSLRAAVEVKHAGWVEMFIPNLVQRLEGPARTRELQARAIASAALACMDLAINEWALTGGAKHMGKLLDSLIAAVRS